MLSLAISSSSLLLSSAVAVAQLTCLRSASLGCMPLAALAAVVGYAAVGGCVSLAVAVIGCNCCSPCSRACRRSTWRAACCFRCCRQLSHRTRYRSSRLLPSLASLTCVPQLCVAYCSLLSRLPSGSIRAHRLPLLLASLACVLPLCLVCCSSLSLQSTAQYAVTGGRVGLSLPSLLSVGRCRCSHSSRAAALYGVPLAALAAVVGFAVIGGRFGPAVALIGCRHCSPRSRACRSSM